MFCLSNWWIVNQTSHVCQSNSFHITITNSQILTNTYILKFFTDFETKYTYWISSIPPTICQSSNTENCSQPSKNLRNNLWEISKSATTSSSSRYYYWCLITWLCRQPNKWLVHSGCQTSEAFGLYLISKEQCPQMISGGVISTPKPIFLICGWLCL